jgi:pimeloyl-ACP methyl ester carboxylesterase
MATAIIDGISTRYDVVGTGPPLLMYAPGGFNAVIESWRTQGVYARIRLLDHLPKAFTCVLFDRRECGQSGGRLERVTWSHFAAQGRALLAHLGFDRAHVMGGCMGCPPVATFGLLYPEATLSMTLFWPVGGARYRIGSHRRFAEHLAFVERNGLDAVVTLATTEGKPFGADPRGGPWASVLRHDKVFAAAFAQQDAERYKLMAAAMGRTLFDRDTAPGPEPEDLMRLDIPAFIVPGRDAAHATSAARYLEECLPAAEYWDVAVADQTEANVPGRIMDFLVGAQAQAQA